MLPASIMENISDGYDKLWKAFIQPMKTEYVLDDLGAPVAL